MIASAKGDSYQRTIETLLPSHEIDALIVIYIPIDRNDSEAIADAIRRAVSCARAAGGHDKPVLACLMTSTGARSLVTEAETIPSYRFPESAAKVLSKTAAYAEWRSKPLALVPGFSDIQKDSARRVVLHAIETRREGWLLAEEWRAVLSAYGIPQVRSALARTSNDAAQAAKSLGFPVALKLASQKVLHKSDAGAVRLNLQNGGEVRQVFDEIKQDDMEGVLIQQMVQNGVELMIGVAPDPLFGPLIAFGLGGIHVEILADVRFRVTPLSDQDAQEMVREIRGYRLLQGYRGHPPADVEAIEKVLLRVSRLVEDIPEIQELDLNPIFGLPPTQGCVVADARIRVKVN
jgi:acyl-CoA synthetase (NDP forming)